MFQLRLARLGLILAALGFNMAPSIVGVGSVAQAQAMRSAVGTPLQAAKDLMGKKKYREALAKVNEAARVSGLTADESFTIERMRAAAASGAGDSEATARSFEALIASGKLSAKDKATYTQSLGGLYYSARNYPKAIFWLSNYVNEGGSDPKMRALLTQTYFLNGEFSRAYKELAGQVQADEKAGRTPSEDQLQLLANAASRVNDKTSYASALEKLATYYPKKDVWTNLLARVQAKPGYAGRLAIDVYRLKMALGLLSTEKEFMEMALLTMQGGFAAEATSIVEQGFTLGILGAAGADINRQKRLQEMAKKTKAVNLATAVTKETEAVQAKDGAALVNLGYDYVTNNQVEKGIGLMQQGIRYGNLKYPEDAKLHLGLAYMLAGRKANAIQTFKTVKGVDGTADLARYWVMQLNRPIK